MSQNNNYFIKTLWQEWRMKKETFMIEAQEIKRYLAMHFYLMNFLESHVVCKRRLSAFIHRTLFDVYA